MKGCGVLVVTVTVRGAVRSHGGADRHEEPEQRRLVGGIADEVEVLLDHGRSHPRLVVADALEESELDLLRRDDLPRLRGELGDLAVTLTSVSSSSLRRGADGVHADFAENHRARRDRLFSKPDGGLLNVGDRLVNKPYADFLRRLASQGPAAALYAGSTAAKIVARTHAGPLAGAMTMDDISTTGRSGASRFAARSGSISAALRRRPRAGSG